MLAANYKASNSSTPVASSKNRKPIKQGWVFKKAGSGLLSPWRPKYLTLSSGARGLVLHLYDNLEDSRPKHEIIVDTMRLEHGASKFGLLSKNAVAFTLTSNTRKVWKTHF